MAHSSWTSIHLHLNIIGVPMLPVLFLSSALAGTSATSSKKDANSGLAVDGQLQTSWMEDAPGHGSDETFTLTLHKTLDIKSISIW